MSTKLINAYCHICCERITVDNDSIIKSKPRKGATIYIHAECFNKEQAELKEARKA